MAHSKFCPDETTRYDQDQKKCIPCVIQPGHYVTVNCGYDDHGGRHEVSLQPCKEKFFNDGSTAFCRPCSVCSSGSVTVRECSSTLDTLCAHSTTLSYKGRISYPQPQEPTEPPSDLSIAVIIIPIVLILMLLVALAVLVNRKRKRDQCDAVCFTGKLIYQKPECLPGSSSIALAEQEINLSAAVLSAPLESVLDDLDVLEELVILLDPDSQGSKSTKHLASLCSFSSTWVTYAYSMKDSKSPLKAVLEGVSSRNPEWTVGHLAKLLRKMERNDAIAVLEKLKPNPMIQF